MTQRENRAIGIVDDDDAVRDSLKVLLESHGMEVREFASPAEFLDAGRALEYRCLVLDLHMPVTSGLDLLETLRAEGERVPAVILTANPDPKLQQRMDKAGLSAVLVKPVPADELLDRIARACASPLH